MKNKFLLTLIQIALMLFVLLFLFYPQYSGKVVNASDIVQWESMSKETKTFSTDGSPVLWSNSMFGGMPTFQTNSFASSNYLGIALGYFILFFKYPLAYFFIMMLTCYFMLRSYEVNSWVSLIFSILFSVSTNNLILVEAGHTSKLLALSFAPLIVAGINLLFKKKYLVGSLSYGIGFSLIIFANHIQMTYYLGIAIAIYLISSLILAFKEKESIRHILISCGLLLVLTIMGIASNITNLWTTYEYGQQTMRGKAILAPDASTQSSSASSTVDGLNWDYAMQWSNGLKDLGATFISKIAGGSSVEWVSRNTDIAKKLDQRSDFQLPGYYGDLPFTAGPSYFGAAMMFLFLFGFLILENRKKWWIFSAVLFMFLLSMGKHFEILNKLVFDYLPLYNKFRAPSSILTVCALFVIMMAAFGVHQLLTSTEKIKYKKSLMISFAIFGGICLILWLVGSQMMTFTTPGDERYADIKDLLEDWRIETFKSSSLRTFLFISLVAGVIWTYIHSKINTTILIAAVGILTMLDTFGINNDYFNSKTWVKQSKSKETVKEPRPADAQILQDTDPYYRVFDVTTDPFNSADVAYFHKSIGGYHPAKLQRYQDIIDRHISKNNMAVLNMLNTKYFIVNGNNGPVAQRNQSSLGNVWLVDTVKVVATANEEIDALGNNFNPANQVIIHKEFSKYVEGINPTKNGKISLKSYHPNKLTYEAEMAGEGLAVFSEIWYGPDLGWKASINGQSVEFIRANYCLRALKIPNGKSQITFSFEPKSYYAGEKISALSSIALLILLIALSSKQILDYRRNPKSST
jgi:steroid 5-alpha reductase family enzyme